MNERERLIELLTVWGNSECDGRVMTESLSDFLISNGIILSPCKVGDKVEVLSKALPTHEIDTEDLPEYYEGEVISMRKNKHGCFFKVRIYAKWITDVFDYELGNYSESYVSPRCFTYLMSNIGKTVFLTKQEKESKT